MVSEDEKLEQNPRSAAPTHGRRALRVAISALHSGAGVRVVTALSCAAATLM